MVKKSTWITGLVMILVAVLAVGVFCAPQASAAEINYGSANLPSGVQASINQAATYQSQVSTTNCPICGKVEWKTFEKGVEVASGETVHYIITEGQALDYANVILMEGVGSTAHVFLNGAATSKGSIKVGGTYNTLAVFGSGSLFTDSSYNTQGLFQLAGTNPTLKLYGGSYNQQLTKNLNYDHAIIDTYPSPTNGLVEIFDGVKIGPETAPGYELYNVSLYNTTMNMYGGEIRNGKRIANGWNSAANVTIEGGGTLNMYGGKIYGGDNLAKGGSNVRLRKATSVFNMYGGEIYNPINTVESGTYGANVLSDTTGTINLQGGKISGGTAFFGGNIAALGSKLTIGGTALITGGTAKNIPNADGSVPSSGIAYGGNIFANSSAVVTMTGGKIADGKVTGGTLTGSVSNLYSDYGYGGNVALVGAVFKMSGGVIEGGSSPNGGSMSVSGSTSEITISGGTISNSRARWGAGIYISAGKLTVSGGTITENDANQQGGNLYITTSANADITGGNITNGYVDESINALSKPGGNIYMNSTGKLTISGGTISGGEACKGGNIGINKGIVEIADVAKIKDGKSFYCGGNIWLGGTGELTISGGRISGGVASDGGNLYLEAGAASITGGTITAGRAYYDNEPNYSGDTVTVLGSQYKGGNIYTTIDLTVSGGTISNGESLTSWGGNIFAKECALNVSGGVITGGKALNTSDGRGGNIAAWDARINISGTASIQNGKAAEGGNIYIEVGASQLNVSGGTITGGKAIAGGNAYLAPKMIAEVTGGTITEGVAQLGGNIYVAYNGKLHQTAGAISGGIAQKVGSTGGDIDFDDLVNNPGGVAINPEGICAGADIYLYDSDYIMQGGTVSADDEQTVSSIYADDGRVYLMATATVSNGNIEIAKNGKLFVDNSWTGGASVVFPVQYQSGAEVDTKWAANGQVTVDSDLTVTFAPGGMFDSGVLQHGVAPYDAIVAIGVGGRLRLGTIDFIAMIGSNVYRSIKQAVSAAQDGDTIILYANCELDGDLYLKRGRTLDLNGFTLTITGEVTAANKTTHIIDSTNGFGVLAVDEYKSALSRSNAYLPVWVQGEGFHFVSHQFGTFHRTAQTHPDKVTDETAVQFVLWMDGTAECFLAQQLANGGSDNGVEVKIKMSWVNSAGINCEQYFTFPEANIKDYTGVWETGSIYLTVKNANTVKNLQFTAMLVYDDAVQLASEPYSVSFN